MSLRTESKQEWAKRNNVATHEEIKTGCLQRIADATELMAKEHAKLIAERNALECDRDRWRKTAHRLLRSNAALRGVIKRMKKGPRK